MWPTPTANEDACGTPNGKMQKMLGNHPDVRWSSPTVRDANTLAKVMRGRGSSAKGNELIQPLPVQVGGTLNPTWVSVLMGYPPNWMEVE